MKVLFWAKGHEPTGIENKDNIETISGLKEGEKVVTSGAYLLKSDYVRVPRV